MKSTKTSHLHPWHTQSSTTTKNKNKCKEKQLKSPNWQNSTYGGPKILHMNKRCNDIHEKRTNKHTQSYIFVCTEFLRQTELISIVSFTIIIHILHSSPTHSELSSSSPSSSVLSQKSHTRHDMKRKWGYLLVVRRCICCCLIMCTSIQR